MATPPYSTAAQVKDSDLDRLTTQAGWLDADVEERIQEGDAQLQSCLVEMGYAFDFGTIANTPIFIHVLSKLYGRAASYRDLFHRSPATITSESSQEMFKRFDEQIEKFKDGKIPLVDPVTNLVLEPATPDSQRVQSNTLNVPRALTMDEPENQHIHGHAYSDDEVLGDAQRSRDHDQDHHH